MIITYMTVIEIAAVILGIASVYLTTKQNIWCWPTGLAMVALYVYIFYTARLYSDSIENFIYIPMQIYGWWFWVYGNKKKKDDVPVRSLKTQGILFWAAVIAAGTLAIGYYMSTYTNASFPYWDALTTVMSLTAQWLMGRKILENWVLWISVDVMALAIYGLKGLYFTTGLYGLFLILAISGLLKWKNSMQTKAGSTQLALS
ncbi:MAG: nicotinamide riboside transporter PnuC [archaeon]